MTNNYFRVGKTPFFFDDRSLQSTNAAFESAREFASEMPVGRGRIAVYRQTRDPRTTHVVGEATVSADDGRAKVA